MIKLIVFDLWKTLAYMDTGYSTIERIKKETGLIMSKRELIKLFENSIQRKRWDSREEAYGNFCRKAGLEPSEHNVNIIMRIRDTAKARTRLYPHTLPMLKRLRGNYKTGILSNSSVFDLEPIRKTPLLGYIDYPLFSFEAGVIKPDPRIFRKMLRMSGCRPDETIMVGDTPDDDVAPAKALGMNAVLFRNYPLLKKDLASFSVNL